MFKSCFGKRNILTPNQSTEKQLKFKTSCKMFHCQHAVLSPNRILNVNLENFFKFYFKKNEENHNVKV